MNNPADTFDQADEEILTYTVSDEALEAAANKDRPGETIGGTWIRCTYTVCCS